MDINACADTFRVSWVESPAKSKGLILRPNIVLPCHRQTLSRSRITSPHDLCLLTGVSVGSVSCQPIPRTLGRYSIRTARAPPRSYEN